MMQTAKIVVLLLIARQGLGDSDAQEEVRRLRFRRPRPKLVEVDNPDGDLVGSPVELVLSGSNDLTPAFRAEEEDLQVAAQRVSSASFRGQQNSGNAALEALIATAQREEEPRQLDIQEVPTRAPFQPQDIPARIPVQIKETSDPVTPNRGGVRKRVRGGLPIRRRPRPNQQESGEVDQVRRRPSGQRAEPVATLERYNHKNEDGSFTFGYVGEDGSFREETRGVDCITRGKYGYIDPDGVKREYTYTSGLSCENDDEDELQSLNSEDIDVKDTVDPQERFRQTQQEQLAPNQIPEATRPRRPLQRVTPTVAEQEVPTNDFSSFGPVQSPRVPQRPIRPAPRPTPAQQSGGALQNLLNIADNRPTPVAAAPAPTRGPVRIAQRPQRPIQEAPRQQSVVPQTGSFDFDAELEGFTLNRPSLTFEQNKQQSAAPASSPNQFQSQLTFNPASNSFQTSLQQNIAGGSQIRLNNNAAPALASTTVRPAPTTQRPSFFASSTPASRAPLRASPATPVRASPATPVRASPSTPLRLSPTPAKTVIPAGTLKLDFEPLNIPSDISQVKVQTTASPIPASVRPVTRQPSTPVRLPPVTPAPTRPQTQATRASVAPSQAPVTAPPRLALPIQPAETPRQTSPVKVAVAPSTPVTPSPAPVSQTPANTFFVFQPFNQAGQRVPEPKPVSTPFKTPVNHNAFQIRPVGAAPLPPRPPVQVPQSARLPQATRPAPQQVQSLPIPQQAQRQPIPQQVQRLPIPQQAQRQPVPQRLPISPVASPQARPPPQRLPVPQSAVSQIRPIPQQQPRPIAPQQTRPVPNAPQLQFGFTPVSQGQQRPGQPQPARPAPFTAFGGGRPQQIQTRPSPVQQFRPSPGSPQQFQAQPQQLGIPPQLQQSAAPQFAQFDSRFAPRPVGQVPGQPQLRPAQFVPGSQGQRPVQSSPFSVFGQPQQLRGA